jgi:post-segregation antitoxin (ccd killing protein)
MTGENGLPPKLLSPRAADQAIADRKWQEENRKAIEAYNRMIEEDGYVFSDGVRTF